MEQKRFKQAVINQIRKRDTSGFRTLSHFGEEQNISDKAAAKLLSGNMLNGVRSVYLPRGRRDAELKNNFSRTVIAPGLVLKHSPTLRVSSDLRAKTITLFQQEKGDWALFSGANLKDWTINFEGQKILEKNVNSSGQRFNKFGFTGCLNFYNVTFMRTVFSAAGGGCEDSVNIVSSQGFISLGEIRNAFADALDADFSGLEIASLKVMRAGNDCIDVSGGTYLLNNVELFECGDKGISIGEKSDLTARSATISDAKIGFSAKDSPLG